jgi:hypothetical protein
VNNNQTEILDFILSSPHPFTCFKAGVMPGKGGEIPEKTPFNREEIFKQWV